VTAKRALCVSPTSETEEDSLYNKKADRVVGFLKRFENELERAAGGSSRNYFNAAMLRIPLNQAIGFCEEGVVASHTYITTRAHLCATLTDED
jgi:hypothetical protein